MWTRWEQLPLKYPLGSDLLAEQLDGGQCFRWQLLPEGIWESVVGQAVWQLRHDDKGLWVRTSESGLLPTVSAYFDAAGQQGDLIERLPWRSDAVLQSALALYPGLRILRQDPDEVLLGFLCSSNKRIVQIRHMVGLLAKTLGRPIGDGHFALPTWEVLAQAQPEQLQRCALGYRANYIQETARQLGRQPGGVRVWSALTTPELMERLQTLPGVGPKVASCVALFGFGRLESFPVDTWVVQAMDAAYGLQGWKPAQLEKFGQVHFGAAAGLAQQYLFSAMRHGRLAKFNGPIA